VIIVTGAVAVAVLAVEVAMLLTRDKMQWMIQWVVQDQLQIF
jgi:hypothetical protein